MIIDVARLLGRSEPLRRWTGKRLARLAEARSPGGWRVIEADGVRYLVQMSGFIDRKLALWGAFEAEQMARTLAAMRSTGCDLFLDVGANFGHYSLQVARAGLAGRVVALEPDPRSVARLRANLLLNPDITVEIVETAASSRTGTARFRQFAAANTGKSGISADGTLTVATAPLDDLFPVEGQRIFLKIDVEGHEADVIAGAERLLRSNSVHLQIESFAGSFDTVRQRLEGWGLRHLATIDEDHFFVR